MPCHLFDDAGGPTKITVAHNARAKNSLHFRVDRLRDLRGGDHADADGVLVRMVRKSCGALRRGPRGGEPGIG